MGRRREALLTNPHPNPNHNPHHNRNPRPIRNPHPNQTSLKLSPDVHT